MNKPKIVAIVGSLRKNSYNLQLAKLTKEIIGERAELEILDYTDVPYMNEDIEYPAPQSVARVREVIKAADAVWFFTPEYNHSYPGVLKNLIDWLSRPISDTEPQVLAGKPALISGVGLGITGTAIAQDYLVSLLSFINMRMMNQPRLTVPNAWQLVDEEGKLELKDGEAFLKAQVDAFMVFLEEKR